jgi:hypothetical protein
MADKLDRKIVLQSIRGYEEANRISEATRFAKLCERTISESIQIFRQLYQAWERTGKTMGGDIERLRQRRAEEAVRIRARLNRAIERMNAG